MLIELKILFFSFFGINCTIELEKSHINKKKKLINKINIIYLI